MGDILFSKLGVHDERKPYYPYPVAVEKGLIEPIAPSPSDEPPGVVLSHGRIPNNKQAGVVPVGMGSGNFVAFDHAAAVFEGQRLVITPAAKSDVNDEGYVQEEGLIIMGDQEGRLTIAGFAIDVVRQPWLADKLMRRSQARPLGRVAVFPTSTLDFPQYEVTDIDNKEGIISAKPRW